MASFLKRGKTWQYCVSAKPKPIRKGGFKTKKEAQVAAAEVEERLRHYKTPGTTKVLFAEYFKSWVDVYKDDIEDITLKSYNTTLQIITENFPGRYIHEINKREYQKFLNDFGSEHAKQTVRKLNTHIRACVQEAIDEGIIQIDFTRKAKLTGKVESKRPEEKHLNYSESRLFLNELYARKERSIGYYLLILALTSGMRFAELVGLTKDDFDFDSNEITIDKTWDYKTGKGFTSTKNDPSNRVIKMDPKTMSLFETLFERIPDHKHGLIFVSPNNPRKVLTNEFVNKILRKTLNDLEIEPVTIHGLRHTHASILLYKKISIYYVSERLGHASIDTTLKYYAHVVKELREEDTQNTLELFQQMPSLEKTSV
ncbi:MULTISPECIES: tyrosine-type recombinase/integrase [Bacillus amyloliquefaciens group]|uniref:tyrosine-type recombinase/integrase n=1 Tax=Bacillus amyloliquefaciens group TaxID=1938374 RepID=UPI00077D9307|nr:MULTISPECIES: tyrosine-type recombinase/integrase [Bacillus amyloliquefaciens group]AMQ71861.1 integrase [Bacillus amyloliquefaciens UMAF6614]MBF6667016.1 site-specific integrase [Bacillus velezensis]